MKSIVTRKVSDAEKQKLKFRLITYMSKLLPNPSSGREPISKFMMDMEQSKDLRENVERICNPASDCKVVLANMVRNVQNSQSYLSYLTGGTLNNICCVCGCS